MQVFEVFVVLLNRKRCRIIYADYVLCNIARKTLIAEKQTNEKTNYGPMKRLKLDFVCKHCVELKSSTNFGSSRTDPRPTLGQTEQLYIHFSLPFCYNILDMGQSEQTRDWVWARRNRPKIGYGPDETDRCLGIDQTEHTQFKYGPDRTDPISVWARRSGATENLSRL